MRVKKEMIENAFLQVKDLAEGIVPGAETWEASYAPQYGGWAITAEGKFLGGEFMSANRISGGAFYQALLIMRDIFEKMQGIGRL